jgi:hypothetical protein
MTATQQQILDELLRLLSCPDRWSHVKRGGEDWIHTGKVFVQVFDHSRAMHLAVVVNGTSWDVPLGCCSKLWGEVHSVFDKLANDAADEADNAILGFLKTAA